MEGIERDVAATQKWERNNDGSRDGTSASNKGSISATEPLIEWCSGHDS